MNTKHKGDLAEQAVIFKALSQGWEVLIPVGDRLSYDIVIDTGGKLLKLQVKHAWFGKKSKNYVVDTRRTKTNRRIMRRALYTADDFDFAVVYIHELNVFYVFPVNVFISYGSEIHLIETDKRQRKPKSADFREAWHLIS